MLKELALSSNTKMFFYQPRESYNFAANLECITYKKLNVSVYWRISETLSRVETNPAGLIDHVSQIAPQCSYR